MKRLIPLTIAGDLIRIKDLIEQTLIDISYFGRTSEVIVFSKNGLIEDYEVYIKDDDYKVYVDETILVLNIIDFLTYLISAKEKTKLGAYLKACRLSLNFTQKELGEKIGAAIRTIQDWESDKRKVHIDFIFKLIKTLKLDVEKIELYLQD